MKHFSLNILGVSVFLHIFAPAKGLTATYANTSCAQMVELVDTRDLKSLDHCGRTGSSPVPGTKVKRLADTTLQVFFIKNAEFAIILELNGYSDCLKIG